MPKNVQTTTQLHSFHMLKALTVCSLFQLLSCVQLCDSMDFHLPGSSVHGFFPGKNTGVACYALLPGIFHPRDQMWITSNWEILKEMEMADHLTCPPRNLYADQEAPVRSGHGTMDWFKIEKGLRQGCILSPYLFKLYEEYIM